ncbi:hypothetical protein FN846DRAFT_903385 [Sphaerosporella brunnea]|uniref:Uncharacterized protein n=1 Tax=Sphaerosporella brunnea TaxID=1250544 RepID=A0A5J5F7E5_9PEZI|nr:hypothetical protein FN846DRAFT_903385 [Sphaerosporella brunnea]
MQSVPWIHHCYDTAQQLPQVGELVMLSFSVLEINFPHGPRSAYCPSLHPSQASCACSPTLIAEGKGWHLVLVTFVARYDHRKETLVTFLPIVSYSRRPKGFSRPTWNADSWMRHDATEVQKLYHLPIPATGWCPPPNPHPGAPSIGFTNWINNRPAWLAVAGSTVRIKDSEEWLRHPNGPIMLSGGLNAVFAIRDFKDSVLPDEMVRIQTRGVAHQPAVFYVEIPDSFDNYAIVFNSVHDKSPPPRPGPSGPDEDCIPDDWLNTFDPVKAGQTVLDWCASLGEDIGVAADNGDTGELSMLQEIAVGEEACMEGMTATDSEACETCIPLRGSSVSASVVCLCGARPVCTRGCDQPGPVADDCAQEDGDSAELKPR